MTGPTRSRHDGGRDRSRPPVPEPLPHPVVDNHCHLDIADGPDGSWLPTGEALAQAAAVGVTRIVQIGCDLPGARWAVEAAGRARRARGRRRAAPQRGAAARRGRAARGGAGGDRARWPARGTGCAPSGRRASTTSAPARRAGPPSSCPSGGTSTLAERLDRTLVIHDRDAHEDVLRILDEEGVPERFVMHCFSGDADVRPGLPGPRRLAVLRRHRDVQERRAAPGGAARGPAGPGAGRDRRAVPHADAATAGGPTRRTSCR